MNSRGRIVKGSSTWVWAAVLGLTALNLGCGSDALGGRNLGDPQDELNFLECARFTNGDFGGAECAVPRLPLFHADPEGESIPISLKRVPATQKRRGQLWLLNGGPGVAASAYDWLADMMALALPDLDVYVPEHRGIGASARLDCPSFSATSPESLEDCGRSLSVSHGASLAAFRTTEAARDVAWLIDQTRNPGDIVFVHGASYGASWLHRLLLIAPHAVDAALFESPTRIPYQDGAVEFARATDEAGRALMNLCAQDPVCALHLGPDPYAEIEAIWKNIDQCEPLARPPLGLLGQTMSFALADFRLRRTIPAFFYRVARCEPGDLEWIEAFLDASIENGTSADSEEALDFERRRLRPGTRGGAAAGARSRGERERSQE